MLAGTNPEPQAFDCFLTDIKTASFIQWDTLQRIKHVIALPEDDELNHHAHCSVMQSDLLRSDLT